MSTLKRLAIYSLLATSVQAWFSTSATVRRPLHKKPSIPQGVRLLILPGFGNNSDDYRLHSAPQGSLVDSLRKRGWSEDQVAVMPLKRWEWLQVFLKGALDLQFWQGTADPTRPAFCWYLTRIANNVNQLSADGSKVVLVCHSAGGWLARAACGYGNLDASADYAVHLDQILGMVTLGTPHLPPPPTVMDMTRGALKATNRDFPAAFHETLFYITVVGKALRGVQQQRKTLFEPTTVQGFAYESYEVVCGTGDTDGDGVVPVEAAHLASARQLTLAGVWHSINAPDRWYGSDAVLDQWHTVMLEAITDKLPTNRTNAASANLFDSFFSPRKLS